MTHLLLSKEKNIISLSLQSNNVHVWRKLNKTRELLNTIELLLLKLVKVVHALKLVIFIFEHSRNGDTPGVTVGLII